MFSGGAGWEVILKVAGYSKISIFEPGMLPKWYLFSPGIHYFHTCQGTFICLIMSMSIKNYRSNSTCCLLNYFENGKLIFIEIPPSWQHEKVMLEVTESVGCCGYYCMKEFLEFLHLDRVWIQHLWNIQPVPAALPGPGLVLLYSAKNRTEGSVLHR